MTSSVRIDDRGMRAWLCDMSAAESPEALWSGKLSPSLSVAALCGGGSKPGWLYNREKHLAVGYRQNALAGGRRSFI